ncbi:hypothetical protein [Pinibacter soli]|uniref:Uncharacterized protein n=1 Tax=Pinibacter soli TaxID=3044211 RepID=A0ABT6RFY3_9BACT|nr:hypothetical protein [Pinibacter soli]MDI3321460.1 hypothetical protein [Pinibacter soli]
MLTKSMIEKVKELLASQSAEDREMGNKFLKEFDASEAQIQAIRKSLSRPGQEYEIIDGEICPPKQLGFF